MSTELHETCRGFK